MWYDIVYYIMVVALMFIIAAYFDNDDFDGGT